MKLFRREFLHLAAGAAAVLAMSGLANAQVYPSRPITMVVPFAAGGGTDLVARIIVEKMRESLGQSVVIENVTGANGAIGTGRVARASPDGYTVVAGSLSTVVFNGSVYSLPYDVVSDFAPIALIATQPFLIAARKTFPAEDLTKLIAWLKSNPDRVSAGIAGVGNTSHLAGLLFQRITGTRFQFVPYRGGAPALLDLIAGQVDMLFTPAADSAEYVRARSIKPYAITAKTRLLIAADIPTVDEAGLPGFYFEGWYALFAPRGSTAAVIARINAAAVYALAHPTVRQRLVELGQEIPPRVQQTPEALAALQRAEIEKWWPIIKAAGIKAQ